MTQPNGTTLQSPPAAPAPVPPAATPNEFPECNTCGSGFISWDISVQMPECILCGSECIAWNTLK